MELFDRTPAHRLLVKLAWPSILGLVANGLYNVVDRIFVGQWVGTEALTAVTVVFPLSIVLFALGNAVGQGVASLVSLRLGAKDAQGAEAALGQGVVLTVVVSALGAGILAPFAGPLLAWTGTPETVLEPAREFFLITLVGFPFLTLSLALGTAIKNQGRAKSSLVVGLVGIVANVVLCAWFVVGLGWGLAGSAWASTLAQALGALVTVAFYLSRLSALRLRRRHLVWAPRDARRIGALGTPTLAANLVSVVLMVVLNLRVEGFGGSEALATVGVINTLINLAYLPAWGLINGAVALFGYYQGAGRPEANRRLVWGLLGVLTAWFGACTLAIEGGARPLLALFSSDQAFLDFALEPLRVFLLLTWTGALQVLPSSYFQAIGRPGLSTALALARPVTLVVFVAVFPVFWGFEGFLAAGPVSDGVTALVSALALVTVLGRRTASVDSQPGSGR